MSDAVGDWITFAAPGGDLRAFVAKPEADQPYPALILVHGVNGCGAHMELHAATFAREGYLTIVPDLYTNDAGFPKLNVQAIETAAHLGKDPTVYARHLANHSEEWRQEVLKARAWMNARPMGGYIDLVRACFDYAKTRRDVAAVGCLGYCMGGRLVGELAAEGAELTAGVIYYGAPPKLEKLRNIRCALSGHYAVTDHAITDKIPEFAAAMAAAGKEFTYDIYDANHGFSLTPGMAGYDEKATAVSMERIKEFLSRHLKAAAVAHAAE